MPHPSRLTANDPILPLPLEQQLEALVEDTLGDTPMIQPEPVLVDPGAEHRRIVITGMGVISPLGHTIAAFWDALANGRSGTSFNDLVPNVRQYPCHVAALVRDWEAYAKQPLAQPMSRAAQFGLEAARMAFADAALTVDPVAANEIGVVLGCSVAILPETEAAVRELTARGGAGISPSFMAATLPHLATSQIAVQLGLRGHTSTIATACAASAQAIIEAVEVLLRGDADIMLAGGSEASISEISLAGWSTMQALSTHNDDPARASRPFDGTRQGFVVAEGAAVVVLETLAHARSRGAAIHGEIIGYGLSSDAHYDAAPDPVGDSALQAMQRALHRANVTPQQVDYINAHAAGTPAGDAAETAAIKAVFGEYASTIPVSSTKSMHGHALGAAGALEAVATILALKHGTLPPTINYAQPDPACDLDYVPNTARSTPLAVALSNTFGFGGQSAALLFQKYVDEPRLSPAERAVEVEIAGWITEQ